MSTLPPHDPPHMHHHLRRTGPIEPASEPLPRAPVLEMPLVPQKGWLPEVDAEATTLTPFDEQNRPHKRFLWQRVREMRGLALLKFVWRW